MHANKHNNVCVIGVKSLNVITFTFIFYIYQSNIYLALNDQLTQILWSVFENARTLFLTLTKSVHILISLLFNRLPQACPNTYIYLKREKTKQYIS